MENNCSHWVYYSKPFQNNQPNFNIFKLFFLLFQFHPHVMILLIMAINLSINTYKSAKVKSMKAFWDGKYCIYQGTTKRYAACSLKKYVRTQH